MKSSPPEPKSPIRTSKPKNITKDDSYSKNSIELKNEKNKLSKTMNTIDSPSKMIEKNKEAEAVENF